MVRKDTRRNSTSVRKPPRPAQPPDPRERTLPGRPGSHPTEGRGRRSVKPGGEAPGTGPGGRKPGRSRPGPNQLKSLPAVANLTASVAPGVLRAIFDSGTSLEPAVAKALRSHPDVRRIDRHLVLRSMAALCRWWGWIEPLHLLQVEEQLLIASLLDTREVDGICRAWASKLGRPSDRLMPVGDAPGWTARAEGLKRWVAGGPVTADPWLLFPAWLRDHLPIPPGDATAKARRLAFLHALQSRLPLWVGVRGARRRPSGTSCARLDSSPGSTAISPTRPGLTPIPTSRPSDPIAKVSSPSTICPRRPWGRSVIPTRASAGGT